MNGKRTKRGISPDQLTIVFEASALEASDGTGANETSATQRESVLPTLEPSDPPTPASATSVATGKQPGRSKQYSLIDKVWAPSNLWQAWRHVAEKGGSGGVDGVSIKIFSQDPEARLRELSEDLKAKTYRPHPVRRHYIPKTDGGRRPLGIPTIRDRIVQQALCQILTPIFERVFMESSHGFRPERGTATAIGVVDRAVRNGYEWIVDADIKGFFDNVDHEMLLGFINEEIADGSVLQLIRHILEAGVLEPSASTLEPTELGTPQGGPISPLLANIYLHGLDVSMQGRFGLVRYADDFAIFARSQSEAEAALELARKVLGDLKLELHSEKTRIVHIEQGFDFLGFCYVRSKKGQLIKKVRSKSKKKFNDTVRARTPRLKNQRKTKRRHLTVARLSHNPRVKEMIASVNRHLRGWHWFFKGVWGIQPETAFGAFDGRVRARIRLAITGRVGPGWWHNVLNNALLAELGLLSLVQLQKHYLERRNLISLPGRAVSMESRMRENRMYGLGRQGGR